MTARSDPLAPPGPGEHLRLATSGCRPDRIRAHPLGTAPPAGGSARRTLSVRPRRGARLPVAGESFDLRIDRSWGDGARRWLTGPISGIRLDVAALGLEPLALVERAAPAGGSEYELERIPADGAAAVAGAETRLHRAIDLWARGEPAAALARVDELLRRDLRCLAAHACLGFFAFHAPPDGGGPERARRHYRTGLAIARLSFPAGFDGPLPWSLPGNRPFLRCLFGHSICLWRQRHLDAARAGFRRLCRLNPGDQLAARLALERLGRGDG